MKDKTMTAARREKQRKAGAERQRRLRAERDAKGYKRREYWATETEHAQLAERLNELRGNDNE